jgi:tripartite-type tricarboxylate transporter receptor subunit TctC
MLVPAGTPRGAITKLHAETARILKLPEVGERLAAEGATVIGSTPEHFAAFLKDEIAKAARIVKAAGMTATN